MKPRWEALLNALGIGPEIETEDFSDKWSPMVVRELRRTLKSRYFGISFVLLTLSCLLVCLLFVASYGPSIYHSEPGRELCAWMFTLLCVPLLLVIPGSLFHAATQEHDQQTIELLSITTLSTDQILTGYLNCGMLQAMMYYSALVPFISFSFLLRGLGLSEMLGGLFWITLCGGMAALWGLMLGSCARSELSRGICGVIMLLGVAFGLLVAIIGATSIIMMGDLAAMGGTLLCLLVICLPGMAIFFGIAKQQFQLTDPLVKPFRVILDENQQVVRFASRYTTATYHASDFQADSAF